MKNSEPRIFSLVVFILMSLAMISCSKKEDEKVPEVSTLPITEITNTTAKGGGTLINETFDNLAFFGLVIDTLPEPTTGRKLIMTGGEAGTGFFTVDISGLKPHTRYYARAYATNKVGVGYGQDVEFISQVEVGDPVQGGVVAYIFKPMDNGYVEGRNSGIIVAESDIPGTYAWGCAGLFIPDVYSFVGFGLSNSLAIVAACPFTDIAAARALNFTLNGYSDWFLPSDQELTRIYQNLHLTGKLILPGDFYWSSSQLDQNLAIVRGFHNNTLAGIDKATLARIRAVRYF